jgi:intracellular multiplication protein IcmT
MAKNAPPADWHWRNTMKPVRFFKFDGRVSFFLVLLVVHMRVSTLVLFAVVLFFFALLERRGLSFDAALRAIRLWLGGPDRPALLFTRKRGLRDTGSY